MRVRDLIQRLQQFDGSLEVAILDGFNGGGEPRAINFGPHLDGDEQARNIGYAKTSLSYADLDTYQGNTIVIMGYGCY